MNNNTDTLLKEANTLGTDASKQTGVAFTPYNPSLPPTISSNSLAPTNPVNLPPTPTPTPSLSPTVTQPPNTTVDANGNASINPPPTDAAQPSKQQGILDKIASFGDILGTKGKVTQDLQASQQLDQKTQNATTDYNAYTKAKTDLQHQIDGIYAQPGISREGANSQVQEITRLGNANLSNLAIVAQASQGLLSAAEKTIKDKLDAQFQPVQDQIDFYTKFAQLNSNDLTESEKFKLQQNADQKKKEVSDLTSITDSLHQALLQNGAPSSTYSALDKINNDYIAGKITAQEAQSKLYESAGKYGVDTSKVLDNQYKQAQLNKLNAETAALGTPAITNPNAGQYSTALSVILGSSKFTKDQKASVISAINSGEDPFSVIKNQAKNIAGQTEATKITNFEVAKSQLDDISSLLTQYYASGGKTNLFSGTVEKTINKLGEVNDPKLVTLATEISAALQIYRNAVSGTAYSVQEGKDISSIFPGINKSEGLNNAILAGRKAAFDSTIDGSYRSVLGSTYDDLKKAQGGSSSSSAGTLPDPLGLFK